MNKIYTLCLAAFLFSCAGSANKEEASNESAPEQESQTNQEEEVVVEETNATADLLLGTWVFEDTKIKITQIITYKEDGTYQMKMGPVDVDGTWELTDSTLITKSRPDAPGQKKTITKIDKDNLWTFWEPKGGVPRELKYKRKVE